MHDFSLSTKRDRLIALATGALLLVGLMPMATAAETHYTDVPSGAYYEEAAASLLSSGALDSNESRLRPSDMATRAELVKLLVNLNETPLKYPSTSSFNDVALNAWYSPYFEAAGEMTWIRGDGNCYQAKRPCYARPAASVNRAEAATLLVRAFGLQSMGDAPRFADNPTGEWYFNAIQTAADNCVLQGDDFSGTVRPSANMNRAEMIVMFFRATQNMRYGRDCGTRTPTISDISAETSGRIRITFSSDILQNSANSTARYSIRSVTGNNTIDIGSVSVINNRTVDLMLSDDLASDTEYRLSINGIRSQAGIVFNDTAEFDSPQAAGSLTSATATNVRRVSLQFSADLNEARAEQTARYTVTRLGGTGSTSTNVNVIAAVLTGNRTVELTLGTDLAANANYQIATDSMLTSGGVSFSDSDTFMFQPISGQISSVSTISPNYIRVLFNSDVDQTRAEQLTTYLVSYGSTTIPVTNARLVGNREVELTLLQPLSPQRSYTVTARDARTTQGGVFTATGATIYNSGTVNFTTSLSGTQEVPSVTTAATGTGTFMLTASGLQYDVTVRNMTGAITGAHFHSGAVGVNGAVIHPVTFSGNRATGTWNLSPEDRNAVLSGNVYFNVHSAQYPNGQIRGQVTQ